MIDPWINTDNTLYADPQLISNIRNSNLLIPNIRTLAETRTSTPTSSLGGTPHSHHSQSRSYQDTETGVGQGDIQMLARRILDFTDSEGVITPSALASQLQASSFSQRDESVSEGRVAPVPFVAVDDAAEAGLVGDDARGFVGEACVLESEEAVGAAKPPVRVARAPDCVVLGASDDAFEPEKTA